MTRNVVLPIVVMAFTAPVYANGVLSPTSIRSGSVVDALPALRMMPLVSVAAEPKFSATVFVAASGCSMTAYARLELAARICDDAPAPTVT